jgi:hypothetical protein
MANLFGLQDIGGEFSSHKVRMTFGSQEDSTCSGGDSSKLTFTRFTSRKPLSTPLDHALASTSTTAPVTTQTQPPGVFSVLRVHDWQPQKSTRKPKKTDVLKRAEEKRAQLKARLEDLKVKLWETTIEHGALLQLMRLTGGEERTSTLSTSGS